MSLVNPQHSLLTSASRARTALVDAALALALVARQDRRRRLRRRRQRVWTRPWLLRRPNLGHFDALLRELRLEDEASFRNYLRMDARMFQELVERVGPHLQKEDTFWRKALTPEIRLAVTLRYLATGDSYKSLQYGFRVAHNTISFIIPETCEAIYQVYKDELFRCPTTTEGWKQVASGFSSKWNIPHAVGAIDGKHVAIRCPPHGGSIYFNYKGFHSIVLLAVVDSDYKFLYCDVGSPGASADGGIFADTALRIAIERDTVGFPEPEYLPGSLERVPYSLIGDDAFPLRPWLMKPFPQRQMTTEERIYNYRLCRARRVVENAFGIMANR